MTGDGLAIDTIEALRERDRSGKNLKLGAGGSRFICHQDGKYRKCERKLHFGIEFGIPMSHPIGE